MRPSSTALRIYSSKYLEKKGATLVTVSVETVDQDVFINRGAWVAYPELEYESAVVERGADDCEIVKMPSSLPGIVSDVDIALVNIFPVDRFDEMPNSRAHGVHMARRPRHGLGDHFSGFVEHQRTGRPLLERWC
jgi:hypothetical protein